MTLETQTAATLPTPLLARLRNALGVYKGQGVNHAGEAFSADFLLDEGLDGTLIEVRFRAFDKDNAFHEERTWISENLLTGKMGLWTVSTNTPGVLALELISDTSDGSYSTHLQFRIGDPADRSRFREQIELGLRHDGCIEYVYSWGVPHEDFGVRSKALLKPVQNRN